MNKIDNGDELYSLIERLYPICRSITGDGVRETLKIIGEYIPIQINEVASGTKVFDWTIPEEWNIKDAYIKNAHGEKLVDFKKLNLHVLNYSTPIDEKMGLEKLKDHLFSLPQNPDWVPYRTSYHNKNWGFCLSHNQMTGLKNEEYEVRIDSSLKPGSLTYGEYYIEGQSTDEVIFTCHTCHPSLCNDNLSGIAVAAFLARELSTMKLKYSYRFLFIPGTIGSITWLSRNEDKVDRIKYGLVLNLLGDSSAFHYKKSRRGNSEIDKIMEYVLYKEEGRRLLDFTPYGYDERQFCSPGFNLPVGRLSRKPHGEFPEYHTSADNLNFINPNSLSESLKLLLKVIVVIEENRRWINLSPKGEPQLGKRGLYKSVGGQSQQKDYQMALLWILNLSDGDFSMLEIAKKSEIDFDVLLQAANDLFKAGLLKEVQ